MPYNNKEVKEMTIEEILDLLAGFLDNAYENIEDKQERDLLCEAETELHNRLRYVNLIK